MRLVGGESENEYGRKKGATGGEGKKTESHHVFTGKGTGTGEIQGDTAVQEFAVGGAVGGKVCVTRLELQSTQ